MMTYYFIAPTGTPCYAVPFPGNLSNWLSAREPASEFATPNEGLWYVEVDPLVSEKWAIFQGEEQPLLWDEAVDIFHSSIGSSGGGSGEDGRDFTDEESAYLLLTADRLTDRLNLDAVPPETEPIVIPPPTNPLVSSGYCLCLGTDGLPEADVDITVQLTKGPSIDGYSYNSGIKIATSDEDGVAVIENMIRGGRYNVWRSRHPDKRVQIVVPNAPSFALPETL